MLVQLLRGIGLFGIGATLVAINLGQGAGAIPPGTTRFRLTVPAGFPPPPLPLDNVLTVQGVALGQRLFNEKKLSGNNTQACSNCHRSQFAFSDQGNALSKGITGATGTRNAPALFNLVYQRVYFWDGRSPTLRDQALAPIQNPVEMNSTLNAALAKLNADPTYVSQFKAAFGSAGITAARLGLALEQYEISILSGTSRFDQWQQGHATLTAQEQRGFQIFRTPFNPRQNQFGADCARCHGGPLFSDFEFKNNGLDASPQDPGLEDFTKNPNDFAKFKTPSLRNLTASGPYMHDGRFKTLDEVVTHYSSGIEHSRTLDPGLAREQSGVQLSAADQAALVAFLKTLLDPQFTAATTKP